MHRIPCRTGGRLIAAAVVLLLALAPTGRGGPAARARLDSLARLSPAELDALFTGADLGSPPVGLARGRLLCLVDGRRPRVRAALANAVWKGKDLADDGAYINRWVGGVRALSSQAAVGPSWHDGRPAHVLEYPPGTPLFEPLRDEFREIEPGLYLGVMYQHGPCPKLLGYVALDVAECP